jgi:hypothetical protein
MSPLRLCSHTLALRLQHMLTALTDEADTVDVSRALRLEVEEGLMEALRHVLQVTPVFILKSTS